MVVWEETFNWLINMIPYTISGLQQKFLTETEL